MCVNRKRTQLHITHTVDMKQSSTLFNEPFQAVDCTGTDHQKQGNKTLQDYISETQTNTKM